MNPFFQIDERIQETADKALGMCAGHFAEIERVKEYNQQKMLKAFQEYNVSEAMFAGSTGYGFDDRGRDTLDKIYAYVFDAEDALARHNFMSGTHTLTVALFGMLRPGDEMLCVTGAPYDTIQPVIGITECSGSLKDFGVKYSEVALKADGTVDLDAIKAAVAGDEVTRCKPDPEIYLTAAAKLGLEPSECVVFEDAEAGIESAKRAGIKVVALATTFDREFLSHTEADIIVEDFRDVNVAMLRKLIEG